MRTLLLAPGLGLLSACSCGQEPTSGPFIAYACEADLTVTGAARNDHVGFALGSLGPNGSADWNGDGVSDLLMGSYQKLDVPSPNDRAVGSATLVLSPWDWSQPRLRMQDQIHLRIEGEGGDRFGRSVAWIGDLDGDGRDDFAVGDIRGPKVDDAWTQRGRVYVFLSGDADTGLSGAEKSARAPASPSVVIDGQSNGHRLGHSIAGVGDIDGDGKVDVLLGAPGSLDLPDFTGRAYVVSGAKLLAGEATLGEAIWTGEGDEPLDGFGFSGTYLGPGAFAVGAAEMTLDASKGLAPEKSLEFNGPGYVRVVSGENGQRIAGKDDGEMFGFALGAADIDGDGKNELLVGAPGWSDQGAPRAGRALALGLRHGSTQGDGDSEGDGKGEGLGQSDGVIRAEVRGTAAFEMAGWSVTGYGTAPNKKGERWAVGSFGYTLDPDVDPTPPCDTVDTTRRTPQAGRVQLLNATGAPLATVLGERNADSAGAIACYLGDLDGSGKTELVLAVFRWDEPAPRTDVGKVCVFRDPN